MRTPLRYPGGKSRAVKQILKMFPTELDTLASPFIGGGSVELACSAKGVQVYGYDAFEPLVCFWQEVIADARLVACLARRYYPLSKARFYELQKGFDKLEGGPAHQAAVFFVLNKSSYSGTTFSGGMSPGHPRFTESALNRLADLRPVNLSVERADYSDSIARHGGDFLYLDPPYITKAQNLYGRNGSLHRGFRHDHLAEMLRQCERWVLSYNDCELVRRLYDGYRFTPAEWTYGMPKCKRSSEVLITPLGMPVNVSDNYQRSLF